MSSTHIAIGMQIHFLNDYLKKQEVYIQQEVEDIDSQVKSHQINETSDYESAIDYPFFRSIYAARLIMYELNAMVEGMLQDLAEPFWPEKQASNKKAINDASFRVIVELVEKHYNIKLKDIDQAAEFENLRNMVNSFKHRKGLKLKKDMTLNSETGGCEFQYHASLEQAEAFLESIPVFIDRLFDIKEIKQANA